MTTETLSVSIPVPMLKAAMLFAAKDDMVRKYLVGVCIEHGPRGVRVLATDGHRMFVGNVAVDERAPESARESMKRAEPLRYVVSRDVIANAIKGHGGKRFSAPVEFVWERETKPDPEREGVVIVSCARITVGVVAFGQQVTTDVQDNMGRFPEYERIIPAKTSGKLAQFNAEYIADCAKARETLNDSRRGVTGYISIQHNGDSAAFVSLSADAFAIVMPMRGDKQCKDNLPEWFTGKPKAEETEEETEAEAA